MRTYWGALIADFRRYYHLDPTQIGGLPVWEFAALLSSLPEDSAWRYRCREHVEDVTPEQAAAITARLRA